MVFQSWETTTIRVRWPYLHFFIARQHTDARYWYSKSVCLSVRPSVCLSVTFRYQMKTGAKYRWGRKICDFLPISRYISQTIQNIAVVTMVGEWELISDLSNGAIYNDLERTLTPFSRSHHYLTLNISQTATDTTITGSAVALHCVKAHRQSQWRSPNFNPL